MTTGPCTQRLDYKRLRKICPCGECSRHKGPSLDHVVHGATLDRLLRRVVLGATGGCPSGVTGFYLRGKGELLGLWDPQNRDPRRKPPPETEKSVG